MKDNARVTWRDHLVQTMKYNNETMDDVVASTMPPHLLDFVFPNSYGSWHILEHENATSWFVWTANYVYAPDEYDSKPVLNSYPRNPPQDSK